jgi:hypothetical protein
MKKSFGILLVVLLLTCPSGHVQGAPKYVSPIQLIANPEKFDKTLITVRGFLVMEGHRDVVASALYLHREDAENQLDNSVLVEASDQMRRDEEKIDRIYVTLTGSFRAVPTANSSYIPTISNVRSCTPLSNPTHPIGLKGNDTKQRQ